MGAMLKELYFSPGINAQGVNYAGQKDKRRGAGNACKRGSEHEPRACSGAGAGSDGDGLGARRKLDGGWQRGGNGYRKRPEGRIYRGK